MSIQMWFYKPQNTKGNVLISVREVSSHRRMPERFSHLHGQDLLSGERALVLCRSRKHQSNAPADPTVKIESSGGN